MTRYAAGEHVFSVFVVDAQQKSNKQSLKVFLTEKDGTPPHINKEKIIISSDTERGYNVTLLLQDDLSGVQ